MKRIFIFIAAALMLASTADAQGRYRSSGRHDGFVSSAEGLGLHFGYVHSFHREFNKFTEDVSSTNGRNGFHVGATKDLMLIPHSLYLQSGLDYVYQMTNPDVAKVGSLKIIAKDQEHRLNVPLKLKYVYPITSEISAFAMVGPTFSFGLAADMKFRAKTENGNASVSYNYYSGNVKTAGEAGFLEEMLATQTPDGRFRRFDTYVGGVVGARFFDILEAYVGYDWGLVNQYKGEAREEFKIRRQQLYVTVAVRF